MQQSQPNRTEKEDQDKDNPALSKVLERNIRTIIHLRTRAARERSLQSRIAEMETKPEHVLAEIERLHTRELSKR